MGAGTIATVGLTVNGVRSHCSVDTRMSLLDLLREQLGLTGSKKGCDHGQCGACTVLLDGIRVNACLVLAVTCEGGDVTSVEGLAGDPDGHACRNSSLRTMHSNADIARPASCARRPRFFGRRGLAWRVKPARPG
jgi:aerobic-type carbon monoxide dehydrogenase small subunit (CoxS/CutS family)